jgi:phosphopantothenoylcysteine decarboxylase / phosphopantothenate---cysteine ligase
MSMNPFVKENLKLVYEGKKILLGITGSIAAFKACDIIRFLRECGAEVKVVLSSGGENFVTKTTLENLTGYPVLSGFWSSDHSDFAFGTHHIETARWADLILIAPATAHVIAKIAYGFADDLLTTEVLAFTGPIYIAPAMNPAMFNNPIVQENKARIEARQIKFLGPTSGLTACGEEGFGRMLEPESIVKLLASAFYSPKKPQHVLITLGPTRTAFDPVRFMTNRSSGLMGASLCWAAVQKGYQVTAICGPTDAALPPTAVIHRVQTAQEMLIKSQEAWPSTDIFISAAAVLDWEAVSPSAQKLKKGSGLPKLEIKKAPDILSTLSRDRKNHQFILGFAAETENPVENARKKLISKGCDAVFVNDVSKPNQGFESELNTGYWLSSEWNPVTIPSCTKPELARKLLSLIEQNLK